MFPEAFEWPSAILTLGVAAAAARLALIDFKRFEIELETLAAMFLLAFLQSCFFATPFETALRLFAGAAFWGILSFGNGRIPGLVKFGAGDPVLIGAVAFLAAPAVLPWAVLSCAFMLATCLWYSVARGKPLLRSMFPAAPPILAAGLWIHLAHWV